MARRTIIFQVVVSVGAAALLALAGCMSPREIMLESRRPRNSVIELSQLPPGVALAEGEKSKLALLERSGTQSLHALLLARDAMLTKRYHMRHDVTLVCLAGNAVVEVEGERQAISPPTAVVIPRLYSYKIVPHRTEEDFVGVMIFSPPFDGEDWVLMEEEAEEE